MEEFLITIETDIFSKLTSLMDPIAIVAGGVAVLTASMIAIWGLYKAMLMMMGLSGDAFLPFIKDLIIKSAVVFVIVSAPLYQSYVPDVLIGSTEDLAGEITGDPGVFNKIGAVMDEAVTGLTLATTSPQQAEEEIATNPDAAWYEAAWGWAVDTAKGAWDAVDFTLGGWITAASIFLKLMVVSAGALYLAIVTFMTVLTSKIFAYISLGVGPLFLFFGCFSATRSWFFSWLSTTLGYLFTFVAVMIVWSFMLTVLQDFFYASTGEPMTWAAVGKSFLACFFFGKVIARVGDLASSWFSAGNITDGTNALVAAAGYASTRSANSKLKERQQRRAQRRQQGSQDSNSSSKVEKG